MQKDIRSNSSDEIDLGELLLKLLKLLNRNKLVFLSAIIIGMVVGAGFYGTKPAVFESSMMLRSDILTEAYSETLTENLNKLIDERNRPVLSQKLSISEAEASHLREIKVENITDAAAPDGGPANIIFLISVEITDNAILPSLQQGIIDFLENNEFVKKRVQLKRERYVALIKQMKKEALELDSLKELVNTRITSGGQGRDLLVIDPSNVYEQALKTFKEELSYEESLELIDSIQLIEGFIPFTRPKGPKLSVSLVGGFMTGLLFAIVIVFIRETGAYLKSIDK
ncbi:hypothetical protein FNH22_25250 [Fulvivirga sp. M361]|uniref:hypothetical protein n=1 Tax=Fulvivirga sp. M361 TaxID=2594266 RepID=UPI00117B97A0|nr:hypothetical protein [Fulvivirga sp. M361]TRX50961.1 hypothetical protein FNH22_25250 [Fulvivirga sp. M361]